jgi:hypothetical protein
MDPVSAILEYLGKMKKNIKMKKSNESGLNDSIIFRENEKP